MNFSADEADQFFCDQNDNDDTMAFMTCQLFLTPVLQFVAAPEFEELTTKKTKNTKFCFEFFSFFVVFRVFGGLNS
jgi:hypothetical protein